MIVQTAAPGQPNLVIFQTDHAATSGQIAAVFGNEQFAAPEPLEPMRFVATHHDAGWQPVDERLEMDVNTGLPHHLTQTPLPYLVQTSQGSPDFNEAHYPFSGLLSSMHTYGLFNGRYGLSDFVFIDNVAADQKTAVQIMLDGELARQERLKQQLAALPQMASYVQPDYLFHNYKLLQFFDTLALYFQMTHTAARGEAQFLNVPRAVGEDVTLTIRQLADGTYSVTPYPFREAELTLHYQGYQMTPQPPGTDLQAVIAEMEPVTEKVTLVRNA